MSKFIDLIGKKFGRLATAKWVKKDKRGNSYWLCRCDCGKEIIVRGDHLKGGDIRSCGCLRTELTVKRSTKHGCCKDGKRDIIYSSWDHMIQRCTNANNPNYKNYGGRGITVCKKWINSPENFIKDMKRKWKPGLTLERRNNDRGYFPENCYWATRKQQQRNRRNNLYVLYEGKNQLLIELCEEYDMPYKLVYGRIYKYGWTPEEALT